jgi:hypothetical protein
MPKLVTVWREKDIQEQARHYVRSYILFPAGVVGLVCMIGALGALGYQFVRTDSYTAATFWQSSALIMAGALCGWLQTRYHRYLLAGFPEVFAARLRTAIRQQGKKTKAELTQVKIEHPGRQLVPIAYGAGLLLLWGASVATMMYGQVDPLPALLMPWAGLYWAKLFFWRGVVS